jgi:hypothetical protein
LRDLLGLLGAPDGGVDALLRRLLGLVGARLDGGDTLLGLLLGAGLGLLGVSGALGLGTGILLRDGRHALALSALVELLAQVVRVLDDAAHLGDHLVEEVVHLALVVATPELRWREVLVEDVLRRKRHVVTSVGCHEQCVSSIPAIASGASLEDCPL